MTPFDYELRVVATHESWAGMQNRNRLKGVPMDERWRCFENFLQDMGVKPNHGMTIDRKDNTLGYFKENCRWATAQQQCLNRRKFKSNKSGLTGVSGQQRKKGMYWLASALSKMKGTYLYCGYDFFEACCARKSWEIKHGKALSGLD